MSEAEQAIDDAITYGTGFYFASDEGFKHIEYSEVKSEYSFGLNYFDDWRCVAEYLRGQC